MSSKRYKCPYCENRLERAKLINHVDKSHQDIIPEGFSATRVVYNSVNKTNGGKCRVCGKPTEWREDTGRYDVLCKDPKCKQKMRDDYKKNMLRVRGTYNILNDPEQQTKMLANRSISGEYQFTDGGKVGYIGTYERKCLEFMDVVMQIKSEDIISPGPTMEYMYNGEKHIYIPDFYYVPYNLIIEVKDGGDNKNTKESPGMRSSRERTIEKERMITDKGVYNYIRLTDNNFQQLIEVFMEIKLALIEGDPKKTVKVNESSVDTILESVFEETSYRSKITDDFKAKGKKNLSQFKKVKIDKNLIEKYSSTTKMLKEADESEFGFAWFDEDKLVGYCMANDYGWITAVEVSKDYKGYGIGEQLLKYAMSNMGGNRLGVHDDNEVAMKLYKKCGFKEVPSKAINGSNEKHMIFMTTDKSVLDSLNESSQYFVVPARNCGRTAMMESVDGIKDFLKKNNLELVKPLPGPGEKVYKALKLKQPFYFYHLLPKGANVSVGIVSLDYQYYHNINEFRKNSSKYRERLCNGWGIYPGRNPESLSDKEVYDGINKFRKSSQGCNQIYLFRYPPNTKLGKQMTEILKCKDVYRVDLDELKNAGIITDVDFGYIDSNTDNAKLSEDWYRNISYDDYFKNYTELDHNRLLFSYMNHISVTPKNGFIPKQFITKITHPDLLLYIRESTALQESSAVKRYVLDFHANGPDGLSLNGKIINWDEADEHCPVHIANIPNYMGINLCSVQSIEWSRLADGQLVDVVIKFIPEDSSVTESVRVDGNLMILSEAAIPKNLVFLDINKNKQEAIKYLKQKRSKYIDYIDNYDGEIIIDQDTDKLAGQVFVGKSGTRDSSFITGLEVYKPYKNKGLGSKLLDDAVKKYHGVDLTVYKDNEVAIRMYKKYGFVVIGPGNTKNSDYYMKLRSKLSKDDKIVNESGRMTPEQLDAFYTELKKRLAENEEEPLSEMAYINEKGEKVPKKCPKCGGDVKVYLRGVPVFLCIDCEEYFGEVPCRKKKSSMKESNIVLESSSKTRPKLYFVSEKELHGEILQPKIPDNYLTRQGYEDNKTKRVCFAPSIDKCLIALSKNCTGMVLNVYSPDKAYDIYKPTKNEVPDVGITGEIWIKEPVKLVKVGKIRVIGDKGTNGLKYTYGDGKEAELYEWAWKYIQNIRSPKLSESFVLEAHNVDLTKFTYYHAELARKGWNPKTRAGGWDEELYSKNIDFAVHNDIEPQMRDKDKAEAYLFTMGEDYSAIYLGIITVYKTSDGKIDWEWSEQEDISQEYADYIREEIQSTHESAQLINRDGTDGSSSNDLLDHNKKSETEIDCLAIDDEIWD